MAAGRSTPEARRQPKLQFPEKRVRMGKVKVSLAHPFFWAPFILVGHQPAGKRAGPKFLCHVFPPQTT